ncbi:hypothetical protein [Arenimonas caeni]|jgi:general secretion pathway protein J|uniref:hypothetical protein n=1 Tax=Arenimonas caeni TaxID=2058085 RepID=UPI002A35C4DE|nr:hypothetical protein [Arenimonas caeni]MDY0022080.1 hypothetical protein [Arenimonas caeni]
MNRARVFSRLVVRVACVLVAAGLAVAFAGLCIASMATVGAAAAAARTERLRAVQGFLRRQLEGALALPMEPQSPGQEDVVFEASAERLRLVAPMPGYLSRGGPHVQTFSLVRGPQGLRLEFQHELLGPEGPLENERPPQVLLDGIAEAAFAVRGLDELGEPGEWQSQWQDTSRVPRLVRLRLRLLEPRARWPELLVAPRLGQAPLPGQDGPGDVR